MTKVLEDAIEKVRRLPEDRQAYAAEVLEQIAADGSGLFLFPRITGRTCCRDLPKPNAASLRATMRWPLFGKVRHVTLRYTRRARADIARIHDYISEHNGTAAAAVVRQIRNTCELLARYTGLGRETDVAGVRVSPIGRYPYHVVRAHATVGARDSELNVDGPDRP